MKKIIILIVLAIIVVGAVFGIKSFMGDITKDGDAFVSAWNNSLPNKINKKDISVTKSTNLKSKDFEPILKAAGVKVTSEELINLKNQTAASIMNFNTKEDAHKAFDEVKKRDSERVYVSDEKPAIFFINVDKKQLETKEGGIFSSTFIEELSKNGYEFVK